jgi:hypothetical protein
MRKKKCLRTPPAGAGPSPKATHQTVAVGWDFAGSAAAKTASIPARGTRISTVKASGSMTAKSKTAKGSPSPAPADEPPVALFSLAEIVDKPIEWVVEGVIPRGELTLITGEAGVGKSGFLAGLIANVTRGRLGPRIAWDEAPVGIQDADLFREVIVNPQDPLARERQFESDRAANWLQERLGSGKVAAFEVQAEAAENEITEALLRRAFRSLGCKTNKEQAKGEKVRWYWRLPDDGCLSRPASPRFMTRPLPEIENRSPSGIPQGKELLVS